MLEFKSDLSGSLENKKIQFRMSNSWPEIPFTDSKHKIDKMKIMIIDGFIKSPNRRPEGIEPPDYGFEERHTAT
jgi:hypothetical protein